MDNGANISDVLAFIADLGYVEDACVGNCKSFQDSEGRDITISCDGNYIAGFELRRILKDVGVEKIDFIVFLTNTQSVER